MTLWPHLSEVIGEPEAAGDQVLEHRQDAAVDLARWRCRRGRRSRSRARGSASTLALRAAYFDASRTWPTVGARIVRTGSCRRRGRSRSPRAASSRRGSASGRSCGSRGRRADREVEVRGDVRIGLADLADASCRRRPCEPLRSGAESIVLRVELEDAGEVGLEGLVARHALAEQVVDLAAEALVGAVAVAVRQREQALASCPRCWSGRRSRAPEPASSPELESSRSRPRPACPGRPCLRRSVSASLWRVVARVVLLADTFGFESPSPGVIRSKSFVVRLSRSGTGIALAMLPRPGVGVLVAVGVAGGR